MEADRVQSRFRLWDRTEEAFVVAPGGSEFDRAVTGETATDLRATGSRTRPCQVCQKKYGALGARADWGACYMS